MNSSLPLVSIVLPVFNAESFLIKAVESILLQEYKNFELILINDGSTDNTLSILEYYASIDSRVMLLSRSNKGLIYSLNEGISLAKGLYIARMDSDDISHPERFKRQVELMELTKSDICGCHFITIDESGKKIDATLVPISSNSFLTNLALTVPFAHGSVMIRRDFLAKNNLYYGIGEYKTAEDYALWVRMYQLNAKFCNVDQFLFEYRDYTYSLSKKNSKALKYDAKTLSKQMFDMYKEDIYHSIIKQCEESLSIAEKDILIACSLYLFTSRYRMRSLLNVFKVMPKKSLFVVFLKFITGRYF